MTKSTFWGALGLCLLLVSASPSGAQSGATRPRRTLPNQPTNTTSSSSSSSGDTLSTRTLDSATPPSSRNEERNAAANNGGNAPAPAASAASGPSTTRAFTLLQQKQNAQALAEARQVAAADPKNSEAWKIAGFAQMNLQQYEAAAADLQRAYDLQRAAGEDDANTVDALARAYIRTEKFEQALPLLVAATTRKAAPPAAAKPGAAPASASSSAPDPLLLYYRGLAEFRTGKLAEAEQSFQLAAKADPKNALTLFYLGRIAYDRDELDAAIASLNRATVGDSSLTSAWALLTTSYLRRAAAATVPAKAEADYTSAVRAGEGLLRVAKDEAAAALLAQALIGSQQFARAAATLDRFANDPKAQGSTLYLLGISYSRTKNFPKALIALERAREKTPDDVNVYRELGYAYEVSKQYAKALAVYQKASELQPAEADLKESIERVRPFAK